MPTPPRTKREYLRELVADKNRWSRPLTDEERALGFLGWHERGYLPHCDFPGLVQFVTFRLADSMPASRRGEWEHLLKIEDVRERRTKLEEYLDRGVGECWLRDPRIARLAEDALRFFHDQRYELLAWCVMLFTFMSSFTSGRRPWARWCKAGSATLPRRRRRIWRSAGLR